MRAIYLSLLAVLACGERNETPSESASAPAFATAPPLKVAPPTERTADYDPNPLGLPSRTLEVATGQKVFVPPEAMLRGAKLGSSFALRSAQVVGKEGDNLLIEGREGPPYKVHNAYVVAVPEQFKPRINGPVVAEWAGQLRHGVLRRWLRDSFVVRFTDTEDKSDRTLKNAAIIAQAEGLQPGNYAAMKEGETARQVLLVSPIAGEPQRWLALGYAGATMLVDESMLAPVPISYEPKEGAEVWALWLGVFRAGTIRTVDKPGLFTVKFERTGKPVQLGWGSAMARTAPPKPGAPKK